MSLVCFKCHSKDFRKLPTQKREVQVVENTSSSATYKGTILSVTAKCKDLYSHTITNDEGMNVDYHGYVPSFFPNSYSGNRYIELEIDPYTGVILNWKKWKKAKKKKMTSTNY